MDRFKKEISVENQKRVFEFTRVSNMNGIKFFITTTDSNAKPIAFSVKETDDHKWKLFPGALRWLYDIEAEISEAIRETRLK